MIKNKENSAAQATTYIAGFICNWAAYSGVEMAGVEGLQYPARVRLVRLPCLGRLNMGLLLRAFELGAGGVILLGCPAQECSYEGGMERAKELYAQMQNMLQLFGIDVQRLALLEVPVGGGDMVASKLNAFSRRIARLDAARVQRPDKTAVKT
jgi:coenzyme F420-reducing hydrogenase delta subunit